MNFKASHLLRAVCAVAALSAFSGTASADCVGIQNFIKDNPLWVQSELVSHFGDDQGRVPVKGTDIGPNYTSLVRTQLPDVVWSDGCSVRVRVPAALEERPGGYRSKEGSVTVLINFKERWGRALVILSQELTSSDFPGQGPVERRQFVKNNRHAAFFSGSLICTPLVDKWPLGGVETCGPSPGLGR